MADPFGQDNLTVMPLDALPGIKKDGTSFDGKFHTDGLWCRFRNNRPKKMGGYKELANSLLQPARGMYVQPNDGYYSVNVFTSNGVFGVDVDPNGGGGSPYDRTPAGFTVDNNYTWQADVGWDSAGGGKSILLCHAGKYLSDISDRTNTPLYSGNAALTTVLTNAPGISVSGGVVCLHPYFFAYGNDGLIRNSVPNNPSDWAGAGSNSVNISGAKVVKGLPIRGGSSAPAGLFWTLTDVIKASFIGGAPIFSYDVVSDQSSILSPSGVVEYDGVFYWAGVDRFLSYNGVVREVPNQFNMDFFFDNMNWPYRCKVWATKIPRWGEIWWFFPNVNAPNNTECNWAVIYNVRDGIWYDTPIGRTAGCYPQAFRYPVMADAVVNNDGTTANTYRLWAHEFGVDAATSKGNVAIESHFTTPFYSFLNGALTGGYGYDSPTGQNLQLRLSAVEPDFVQVGDMMIQPIMRSHAQDSDVNDAHGPYTMISGASKINTSQLQGRLVRLKFSSNVQGGNYHAGKVIIHPSRGDRRE